jgi:DNA repair exonuclease SbcCD ATPase subunit
MGESLETAKSTLERVMEALRGSSNASENVLRDLMTRLQAARNVLIQNERKIWLRTKAGKEMLSDYGEASLKLLGAVESGSDLEEALTEVEAQAKKISDEIRKRSMVVT